MLKWFNNVILFGDRHHIKRNIKPFIKKLIIIKSTVLKGRLKKTITIKFNNITITVEMSNNFNTKSIKIKSIKINSTAESVNIKLIRESKKNSKISTLGKNTLFSFKKLLLKSIDLLK